MMGDDSDADALAACVDEFDRAIRALAWQLATRVIAEEYAARRRETPRARARNHAPEPSAPPPAPIEASPAPETADPPPATPPAPIEAGGRRRWTRETVIAALCEWLISGITEASFLRRHGQPGLVAAATRIFGRFDSALNVANLYLAKQYPDGPPSRRNTPPVARAVARRAPEPVVRDDVDDHDGAGAGAPRGDASPADTSAGRASSTSDNGTNGAGSNSSGGGANGTGGGANGTGGGTNGTHANVTSAIAGS
jgi:uncharacterized membrane protein YgcG